MATDWTRRASRGLRAVVGLLLVTFPFACAVVAAVHAPASHLEIAGQRVAVKPVLGQNTSRLLGGALVLPDHVHVGLLGKDVGVDLDADWNRVIPSDRRTRAYLVALWEDPTPQVARIETTARRHLIGWSAAGFLLGLAASVGVILGTRHRRRRLAGYSPEQADLVRRHNRVLRACVAVLGVAAMLLVDLAAVAAWRHDDHRSVIGSPIFAGTALEGTQVNGLAAEVVPFLSILRPRSAFYDTVAGNLERALGDVPSLQRTDDEVVLVLAEDFEDVTGMARQVGLAADLVDANLLALTGDLTFAGLPVETYIIDTVDYYSGKRPVYLTPGLHDTPAVLAAAEARNWHVADGEVVEVDGLTLLPLADPRISTVGSFGSGSVLREPEVDVDRMVDEATDVACAERPDLVLLHDHVLGRRIAEAGCQDVAVLDGRSFEFVGPQAVTTSSGADAIQFTGGSTGGHTDTRPNPGKIRNPARFAILTFRTGTDEATYAVVTVSPDTSVTVTPEIDLRQPYQRYVDSGSTGLSADVAGAGPGPGPGRP
jgi:hypothetical protein